jgi:iron complex outermembrane receptor protein
MRPRLAFPAFKINPLFRVILVAYASLVSAEVSAIDPASDDLLDDVPMVLTASRISQSPLDAPAPVTIIDRETILDSGFTEIHDIFRLVPGFLVADWPDGSPIVINQGMGDARSRRLLVMVDGRAFYNPFQGGVDWQDLPLRLDDIERIEIVRGPNAASYGANAFQGVINIITRAPLGEHESGLIMRAGKEDIGDIYAYIARSNNGINWRISASAREATNFRDLDQPLQNNNEAIRRQAFNSQLSMSPRRNEELTFHMGISNGDNDIGQINDASDPPRTADKRDYFFDIGWKRFYGENSEISFRYYHYGHQEHDQYRVFASNLLWAPTPSLTVLNNLDVRRDDIEFQQIHAWSNTLTGLWGAGLRNDAAKSPGFLAGLGSVGGWQTQLFGNIDWTLSPDWLLHVGGMVEKHYNTDLLFSPRLALNYRITPTQSLRFSTGYAYRAPTIFESNAREMVTWSGGIAEVVHYADRKLEPEKLKFVELGYIGHLLPIGLRIDARAYLNKYNNFIDEQTCILDSETNNASPLYYGKPCGFTEPAGYERLLGYSGKPWIPNILNPVFIGDPRQTDPLYTDTTLFPPIANSRLGNYKAIYFLNSGSIRVHGFDLSLDWQHRDLGRFRLSHAITRINSSGVNYDEGRDRDMEASAPHFSTSLLWSKQFTHGLRLSLGGHKVGVIKWPNDGDDQPAYRRLDLRISKTLSLFGKDEELALTLQNFNTEHTEFRDEYLVERRAFVTYRINF